MKVLNYNTIVKFKHEKHGLLEGKIYYHEKVNGVIYYYVDIDLNKFKQVNLTLDDNVITIDQVLNIDEIKDSDWVDESEI